MNKPLLLTKQQDASLSLMRNDLRFLYTVVNCKERIKSNYIVSSMPYIGLIVDGIEDWIKAYNNSHTIKLDLPTFTLQEQKFYEKMRSCIKLWENSYTDVYNELKRMYLQSDKYFSNICKPIAKALKLYDIFGVDLEKFPQMKLLDLTSNSFNNDCILTNILKKKDNLVLFNDNIFISNCEENNNIYINYLQNRLKNLNFELKTLHLCFAYDEKAQTKLQKLKLSPSIKISLIKLDLSFCGLKTDSIIKFLKNNYGLFSLKVLNLKYNNIESNIFEEFVCDDEINLEKLTSLNLSENQINCQKYEENEYLIKFIEKFEKLEVIKLYFCAFFNLWNMNISPEVNHDGKLRKLYEGFKDYLNKKNRKFVFQIDKNKNCYIEKRFDGLFEFK